MNTLVSQGFRNSDVLLYLVGVVKMVTNWVGQEVLH